MGEPVRLHPTAPPLTEVSLPLARVFGIAGEYEDAGRYDDAEALLRAVIKVAPHQPDALHLLGVVASRNGRLEESARLIEQAIAQSPNVALFFRNICTVYERLGRYEEAITAGRRAVELHPYDAHAYHNLTLACHRALQLDESITWARRAVSLEPALAAPHLALAESLLLRGEFEAGWEEYEWRFEVPGASKLMPQTDRPQWDGTPIPDGALLLIADQGFGDVIQFSRYIPWAAQRCPNLVLACAIEMQALMRHNYPGLRLFDGWGACPEFAAFCPLSGLPRLHRTRIDTIPVNIRPICAEPSKAAAWKLRLERILPAAHRRIGINWAGRPQPPNRSTSLQALAPIALLDGIALVSLQMGEAQNEIGSYYGRAPLVSLGRGIGDFMDTAAIIENLDLVLTIDTAVAHLAAAMGKPVWIMLPSPPDWRWLLHRDDSPWYPTARLFRQPAPRQWGPVMARIAEELRQSVASLR